MMRTINKHVMIRERKGLSGEREPFGEGGEKIRDRETPS